jgi:hypothetical protein
VLLNKSHPFHDLVLVLSPEEKRLFDGIDGRRTVAEIADYTGAAGSGSARTFFQTLWWYDQVVFDASPS